MITQSNAVDIVYSNLRRRQRRHGLKDIWGWGQGIGVIHKLMPAVELLASFKREYAEARALLLNG